MHKSSADKQLRIEVTQELHQEIRRAAADQHKSIKQYILDLVNADTKGSDSHEIIIS